VKPGMSRRFSESRDTRYVSSAMYIQNVPGENGELNPLGHSLRPLESGPDDVTISPNLAWSRLGVETAELSEIACC